MNDDALTEVGMLAMHLFETEIDAQDRTPWMELPENIKESWRESARKCLREAGLRTETPTDHIRPKHYGGKDDPYEPLKTMLAWHGKDAVVSFCWLTAEKYLARAGKKSGEPVARDLRKAAFYLTHAADLLEKP